MTLQELALDFPGWPIWLGKTSNGPSQSYAMRRDVLSSAEELSAGMTETASGADVTELQDLRDICARSIPATSSE